MSACSHSQSVKCNSPVCGPHFSVWCNSYPMSIPSCKRLSRPVIESARKSQESRGGWEGWMSHTPDLPPGGGVHVTCVSRVGSFPKLNKAVFVNMATKPPSFPTNINGALHLPWKLDFGSGNDIIPKMIVFQCNKSECQFWPLSHC